MHDSRLTGAHQRSLREVFDKALGAASHLDNPANLPGLEDDPSQRPVLENRTAPLAPSGAGDDDSKESTLTTTATPVFQVGDPVQTLNFRRDEDVPHTGDVVATSFNEERNEPSHTVRLHWDGREVTFPESTLRPYVTPDHLRHHEYAAALFTESELRAIHSYEEGDNQRDGARMLINYLAAAEHLADSTEETTVDGDGFTAEQIKSHDRGHILACFAWLDEWYVQLDSLKAGLRNGSYGPAHTNAGMSFLKQECANWYRTLHLVRREACKWAFGTAGPQPEVDSGYLTFFDIPGVPLDGTIAAESQ